MAAQNLPQKCFRATFVAIHIGGIEQRDTGIKAGMHHCPGCRFVTFGTKIITADTDGGYQQAGMPKTIILHKYPHRPPLPKGPIIFVKC